MIFFSIFHLKCGPKKLTLKVFDIFLQNKCPHSLHFLPITLNPLQKHVSSIDNTTNRKNSSQNLMKTILYAYDANDAFEQYVWRKHHKKQSKNRHKFFSFFFRIYSFNWQQQNFSSCFLDLKFSPLIVFCVRFFQQSCFFLLE